MISTDTITDKDSDGLDMSKLTDEIYQFLWDWLKLAELGQKRVEAGELLVKPKIQIKKITATGNVLFYFNTEMLVPPDLKVFKGRTLQDGDDLAFEKWIDV